MAQPRIRILFNRPNANLHGGIPTVASLLEKELHKNVELQLFEYGRRTDDETIFRKLGSRSLDLITLRSKILAFQPHIIHHNSAFDRLSIIRDAPLVWLAKRCKISIFLMVHGSFNESFGKMNALLARLRNTLLKHADCIGVLSEIEKKAFLTAWPFLGDRLRVVKNIIRPDFYTISRQQTEFPTLLFMSRFIRRKGIFDLLDAVPAVLKKFPTAQLIFVGSGNDAIEFDKRVAEKGLTSNVQRVGHVSHLATSQFYASAWALVFPTHFPEGMPMVVAEAMAAGVPIITTRTRFSQSYMLHEKHCLFIDYNSPASIADAIIHLLECPGLMAQMSQNNRELAKLFEAEIVTSEYLNIYRHLRDVALT
jgi:glycosyltransferase involved in cell wall biosynthesis